MGIRDFRELVNIRIYDSKSKALQRLQIASFLVSITAVLTIIYRHGFPVSKETEDLLFNIIQGSFTFYALHYLVKVFYDFNPLKFLKRTWFEGFLMLLLLIEAISYNLFDTILIASFFKSLGFERFAPVSNIFLQLYLLIMVGIELGKNREFTPKLKVHPAVIFIITFFLIILSGSGLLMLPEMTVNPGIMPFIDALFTSTSATCVTGLIVVDTATYFTFKGQFVIMILMQLGGLNIVAFGASLGFFAKFGLGMKHHSIVEDFVFQQNALSSKGLLGKIILSSFIIELIGVILIMLILSNSEIGSSSGDQLFFAAFHSISAFNNAGFSTLTNGMMHEYAQYFFLLHIVLGALIFIGSMGFNTFFDLFGISKLRERLESPWKKPALGSLLNLYTTLLTIVIGTGAFLIFEWDSTMSGYRFLDKIITGVFQVISMRTAGFSSVDFHQVALPMLVIVLIAMFIGGGSTSTAGGIKTSTFSVLILSVLSTIRGKKHVEVFKRTIPKDIIYRAITTFFFAMTFILIGVFILTITEQAILQMDDRTFVDIIFEEVSAFSTVGLSTGITPYLSSPGKIVIVLSMFIGRLGTLTIAYALSKHIRSTNYKYPDEHLLIG